MKHTGDISYPSPPHEIELSITFVVLVYQVYAAGYSCACTIIYSCRIVVSDECLCRCKAAFTFHSATNSHFILSFCLFYSLRHTSRSLPVCSWKDFWLYRVYWSDWCGCPMSSLCISRDVWRQSRFSADIKADIRIKMLLYV